MLCGTPFSAAPKPKPLPAVEIPLVLSGSFTVYFICGKAGKPVKVLFVCTEEFEETLLTEEIAEETETLEDELETEDTEVDEEDDDSSEEDKLSTEETDVFSETDSTEESVLVLVAFLFEQPLRFAKNTIVIIKDKILFIFYFL